MAASVYILCALSCVVIAFLLLRGFRATRQRLLFWSMLCFIILAFANLLLIVDLVIFPTMVDLGIPRTIVSLLAVVVLIYGFIFESE
ncbi:MAG TPA: DUF5985 family protein [Chthoniobacterales bacterium]|jgi:uncharacterized membrane protein